MAAREACEGDRIEDLKPSKEAGKKRPDVQEERNAKGAELHLSDRGRAMLLVLVQPVLLDQHHWIGEAASSHT
jgi:hypothetical protein